MTATPTTRGRRRRSDAGTVRITARDLAALGWLADMKAIYENDIAALCMRLGSPFVTEQSPADAVRKMVARWRRAGIADSRKLVTDRPRIVRLLRGGAELAGVEAFRETAPLTAYHQCEVSRVRLYLERRPSPSLGRLTHWESERAFRSDLAALGLDRRTGGRAATDGVHVPDGVATYENGDRVAIEVERSVKAPARLARIVERLLAEYPVTLYAVTSREVRNAVLAADRAARAGMERRQVSPDRIGALSIIDIPQGVS